MDLQKEMDQIAEIVAQRARRKLGRKASLRVVDAVSLRREIPTAPEPGILDGPTRSVYFSQIRDRARMYWLQWIVRQECAYYGRVLEELEDEQLISLAKKMEQGWQCRVEGVAFDEMPGLVREGTIPT